MNNSVKHIRQDWVDIIKGFAIISVVVGHIAFNYPDCRLFPVSDIIAWLWHVPVFFMVGGFFISDEKLQHPKSFIIGKVKGLYLPILYLYIPATLLHNIFLDVGLYDTAIEYGGKHVVYWTMKDFGIRCIEAIFFAGREPILGAMWFAYVLFMALCLLSILRFAVKKGGNDNVARQRKIFLLLLMGGVICSCLMTNVLNFTIPRFNNVLTAAWLIYVGFLVKNKYKVEFNNKYVFIICAFTFYCLAVLKGGVHLNRNEYDDPISLTSSSFAALYILGYIAKKCRGRVANIFICIGKDSFWIMGLHFFAFKICMIFLNMMGCQFRESLLMPPAEDPLWLLLFTLGGIFIPLGIIYLYRYIKNKIVHIKS